MPALLLILLSFAGALLCALTPAHHVRRLRVMALTTAIAGLAVAICCCLRYEPGTLADTLRVDWIPSLGIQFLTGYDGISLPLLLVTGLVAVCGVLFTWNLDHLSLIHI